MMGIVFVGLDVTVSPFLVDACVFVTFVYAFALLFFYVMGMRLWKNSQSDSVYFLGFIYLCKFVLVSNIQLSLEYLYAVYS